MSGIAVYRFGPFEFDPTTRLLFRDQQRIERLSDPQSAILACLVSHSTIVISKETLIDAGWGGMAINENSLDQAISRMRKVLGDRRGNATYIETLPHEGYRFKAPVQQIRRARRESADASLEGELAPFLAFVQGQTELDTLDRDAIARARRAFEDALRDAPEYGPVHVGLAMTCGLAFEASRPDAEQDTASLELGVAHACEGCRLAPESGEAWSALAFVLFLSGETQRAAAAAYKAMALDPENWRHALRAGYVTWGGQRLRAARDALARCADLALAQWLRTTVFIARGALDTALEVARVGCAAQDAQTPGTGVPGVGLHLLHGLLLAAHDRLDQAEAELTRELSWADSGQVYARECAANTWYALGAVRWRQRKRREADAAFTRALAIAPRHVSATAALRGDVPTRVSMMDSAIGRAIVLARGNRHAEAASVYRDAIAQAPPGSAGWQLPVEPLINPLSHQEHWADALAMIRRRAI
jgi:DNA-binding winged helix-turn-helix (wHTH) protein/Tfp pilus assembly protein PilF